MNRSIMKKLTLIALSTLLILSSCTQKTENKEDVSTYYLIRHAEKELSENPNLTEEGLQRAENWAKYFKDIKFDAIYATNTNRTIQTATPTAKANNIEIKLHDPDIMNINNFMTVNKGKNVLIVGHVNTTPMTANDLLGEFKYEEISDDNFSNLYVVTVKRNSQHLVVPSGN